MDVQQQLVAYARKIAEYVGYTNLVNGLQSWVDLANKRLHEEKELLEAQATKTSIHVLHEAADVLYYSACMAEQEETTSLTESQYSRGCSWLQRHDVNIEQAEVAAIAKYEWRSAAPGNKDEIYELSLIKEAIERAK